MLNTVEEIEQEIVRLLLENEDELLLAHERIDFIVKLAEVMLEDYELQLDEYYTGRDEEEYREEYLAAYRKAKQNILESTQVLLQKEAEGALSKV